MPVALLYSNSVSIICGFWIIKALPSKKQKELEGRLNSLLFFQRPAECVSFMLSENHLYKKLLKIFLKALFDSSDIPLYAECCVILFIFISPSKQVRHKLSKIYWEDPNIKVSNCGCNYCCVR